MEESDPTVATPDTADDSHTAAADVPLGEGDVTVGTAVGRYIVLAPIGKGGSGVVYAAFDPRLDRKIALKLVQPSPRGHERLLREAQAMAQLSHPNVVAVFDAGTFGSRVFVAMELVEGTTLRRWQREEARPWRDVLRKYLAAGAGLEAAHARGLVHRDFKPDNVLVGLDGAVRVVDFGLVLRADSIEEPISSAPISAPPTVVVDRLTHMGTILGTPGYMAPEQYRGERADARSDQFSFCASLYEGLYRARPFEGRTIAELKESTCAGRIRPPDRRRKVPARLLRALERGLAVDPSRRWPSMTELLAELARDRARAWRRGAAIAVAASAVAASIAVIATRSSASDLCAGAGDLAARAWNPAIEERIASAFAATGLPHAVRAREAVATGLARFTRDWSTMRRDACLATRVRGEQSEAVLTLRVACLDAQLDETRAVAELLARGGRDAVQRAVETASRLPQVERCGDVPALLEPTAIPSDPAARARVEQLRRRIADARALVTAGEYATARAALEPLVIEARATAYLPLEAEALLALGRALVGAGDYGRAEQLLLDAEHVAEESRHDAVRAQALLERVEVTGRWLGHYADAERDASRAARVARRLGDPELAWGALDAQSRVHGYLSKLDQAVAEGRQSIALAERLFGPDDLRLARSHGAVSIALAELGRFDEAEAEDRLALTISERALGATHPSLVRLMTNVATDLVWAGRPAEALPIAERAEALAAAELGADHPQHGLAWNMLGYTLNAMGRYGDALAPNQKALALYERLHGADYVETVYPLIGIGESYLGLGDAARALPALERAAALAAKHGLDPETMGTSHYHLGRAVLLVRRDRARAVALVQRAATELGKAPRLAKQRQQAEAWLTENRGS